jgi:hypothetical protein
MHTAKPWTKKELDQACKILGQHARVDAALQEISARIRPVHRSALGVAFNNNSLNAPASYLKQVKPVERHEQAQQESRARVENKQLIEEIKEHRERWAAIDALRSGPLPTVKARELSTRKREGCAIILASDWHIEETVEKAASPLQNVYTPAEAAVRVGRFFRRH